VNVILVLIFDSASTPKGSTSQGVTCGIHSEGQDKDKTDEGDMNNKETDELGRRWEMGGGGRGGGGGVAKWSEDHLDVTNFLYLH
jgi:hypothetical protein